MKTYYNDRFYGHNSTPNMNTENRERKSQSKLHEEKHRWHRVFNHQLPTRDTNISSYEELMPGRTALQPRPINSTESIRCSLCVNFILHSVSIDSCNTLHCNL